MKRFVVTLAVLLCFTMMMTGADIRSLVRAKADRNESKPCIGYTIIEVDKGVNCAGDTVQLKRVHGYYEVVTPK